MGSWSALRNALRQRIVPELRPRVDVHYTLYEGHYHYGDEIYTHNWRLWLTLDKVQIFSSSYYQCYVHPTVKAMRQAGHFVYIAEALELGGPNADVHLAALRASLSLSIAEARNSVDPVVRALSWLDIRTGVRTLKNRTLQDGEHELVKLLHQLRKASA